ncbi:unnamed protein product [Cochlearia groenlandica]
MGEVKVARMAAPMVVVNIYQTLIQATSTMIVGHKSEISLAGIVLAAPSLMLGTKGATLSISLSYWLDAVFLCTNVANELRVGNLTAAKASTFVAMIIVTVESSAVNFALFISRHVWGYAYSNISEVISYVAEITPILCLSIVMDNLSAVLTGVMRGTGKEKIGAYVIIGAFYMFGITIGLVFCFILYFKVKGLWIGILCGFTLQTLIFFLITTFTSDDD